MVRRGAATTIDALASRWVVGAIIAVLGVWAFLPTRLFLDPRAVEIEGAIVRVHREFPLSDRLGLPRPMIRYVETVRAADGRVCSDTAQFRYTAAGEFGEWPIDQWAAPCTAGAFVWRAEWRAIVGPFALRPVALEATVYPDQPTGCPWRISTSGRIHGPDSPYRAMTAATRCFETRAAAEAALQEDRQ